MAEYDIAKLLSENPYPGRGIIIGQSADGKRALIAYFIMGRSENSRNRVFEEFSGGIRTKAFDESKMKDPSLIIYNAFLCDGGNADIVTNGNQTDTVYSFFKSGSYPGNAFEKALCTREYEPDAPNYTPRISGIVHYGGYADAGFGYSLSVLKRGAAGGCDRFFFNYEPAPGIGHFIHTYKCDGDPLPSFEGEPEEIALPCTAEELGGVLWKNLNGENKVSLFVRSVEIADGKANNLIINKNG